jgi:hypothetical protein
MKLLNNIKVVFVAKEAPNNGYILNDHHEWYGTQSAKDAARVLEESEAVYAKRFHGTNKV